MKFRMVDQIHRWEKQRSISGVKTVSFEEYNLKAPFGSPAHLPETLLIESLFQSLGINHPKYRPFLEKLGPILATVIVIGNISIPLMILLGWIELPAGGA